ERDQLARRPGRALRAGRVDVVQDERRRAERGERQDVACQLHREHPPAGPDDDDPRSGHGRSASPVRRSNRWRRAGDTSRFTGSPGRGSSAGAKIAVSGARAPLTVTGISAPSSSAPLSTTVPATVPCTTISFPTGSTASTVNAIDGPEPFAGARSSGRIPTATSAGAAADHGSERSPTTIVPSPVLTRSRFIGGLPMNPATKRFSGLR